MSLKRNLVFSKIRVLSSGTLSKTLDLENCCTGQLATADTCCHIITAFDINKQYLNMLTEICHLRLKKIILPHLCHSLVM